jgi:hypothetical protein
VTGQGQLIAAHRPDVQVMHPSAKGEVRRGGR